MKEGLTRKYTNGEVTVVWKPDCASTPRGASAGFLRCSTPGTSWVTMSGAPTSDIIAQVEQCRRGTVDSPQGRH